jgi:predicted GNAT superfamily acetyltransferase
MARKTETAAEKSNNFPVPFIDTKTSVILALNNEHVTELSWLSEGRLEVLARQAFYARSIGDVDAFLIAFDQTAAYDSPNYLWFRQRYSQFVYIDRVLVSPSMRGRGYARLLYRDLFDHAHQKHHHLVVCEVNLHPPNPASDGFHASMEFHEVGRATIHNGSKTVRYLAREI